MFVNRRVEMTYFMVYYILKSFGPYRNINNLILCKNAEIAAGYSRFLAVAGSIGLVDISRRRR